MGNLMIIHFGTYSISSSANSEANEDTSTRLYTHRTLYLHIYCHWMMTGRPKQPTLLILLLYRRYKFPSGFVFDLWIVSSWWGLGWGVCSRIYAKENWEGRAKCRKWKTIGKRVSVSEEKQKKNHHHPLRHNKVLIMSIVSIDPVIQSLWIHSEYYPSPASRYMKRTG